jgi:hypothetical protein
MAQYQVVDHFHIGLGGAEICLIERTISGEDPVCFQFKGDWAKAEIEAGRLNTVANFQPKRKSGRTRARSKQAQITATK